ncbi:MAG: lysophospholipid acyltransferase family protein [Neisseriaceae bacterium]|nr:lysophospholipid acyltransferase family protein [Neisseriaceae bacterium]
MSSVISFIFRFIAKLPLPVLYYLGGFWGSIAYFSAPNLRRRIRENLRQADLPCDTKTARLVAQEAVRSGLELTIAWTREPNYMVSLFKDTQGWEYVEQALENKQGLLFITPHLGSYDLAGRFISENLPFDLTAMYRPPKKAYLEPIMTAGRERGKGHAAPANASGVRQVVRALKKQEAVIILPDQVPQAGEGVWVPFFGKTAYTMTLAARLAVMNNVTPLMFCGERLKNGKGFRLNIVPFSGELNGDKEHDAALINQNAETLIRRFYTQYLFSYNRYKTPAGVVKPDEK